ncbi:MAG: dephospho-CoA kinase [Candidatus Omnitrophota bacterium]|nr:dephospho-CoA kinase [Candidatus Omnitrophota bacterium]
MSVFGVTGKLASGKSTLVELLKKKGAKTYDLDDVIHRYYRNKNSEVYKKIITQFPRSVGKNKQISRKKLGEIVFACNAAREKIEKIVHPVIIKDLRLWVKENRKKEEFYIAEVPLLFEKNLACCFDRVILVVASRQTILCRVQDKFGISKKDAAKRLSFFISDKEKRKGSDFVVKNRGSMEELKKEVDVLWEKIKLDGIK